MMPNEFDKQRGAMAITASLWLIAFVGFMALAFDIGHALIVRNELQNGADAAALAGANCLDKATSGADCTNTPSPTINWAIAATKAATSIGLNKSDGANLVNGSVQTGYWNVNGGTALQATTLSPIGPCTVVAGVMTTTCDKPAVMVTLNRATGSNGGPVGTLVAAMFGGTAVPVSARAVAVLSSPGNVLPGNVIPQAINKCMFDLYWNAVTNSPQLATATTLTYQDDSDKKNPKTYSIPQVIGQPLVFRIGSSYHYGLCDSGQWTTFDQVDNSVPTVRGLISNGNPSPLGIGQNTWIQPGTQSTVYDALDTKYPTPSGSAGWDVTVVVVNQPGGLDQHAQAPVVAFAGFHIDDIRGSSGPNPKFYIEGHLTRNITTSGSSGIGPYYGSYTPPRLAQ